MAGPDVNYDTVQTYNVSPAAMMENVNKIKFWNSEIHRELVAIQDRFTHLALGWAGQTKQEATEVMNRWNAVSVELFGTGVGEDEDISKATPSQLGVLQFILRGMAGATEIYAGVELGIEKYYKDFRDGLASAATATPPAGPTAVSHPADISNTHETAVGEHWNG